MIMYWNIKNKIIFKLLKNIRADVQFTRISHPFVAWKLHLENVARNQCVPSVINMEHSPELERFPEMEQVFKTYLK